MNKRYIIGLASGSSANGVEAALVEIEGAGLHLQPHLVHWLHQPYGADLRELILNTSRPGQTEIGQVSLLNRLVGEAFAAGARQVADRASFSLQKTVAKRGYIKAPFSAQAARQFTRALRAGALKTLAMRPHRFLQHDDTMLADRLSNVLLRATCSTTSDAVPRASQPSCQGQEILHAL